MNKLIDILISKRKVLSLISLIVLAGMTFFMKPAKISGELTGFRLKNSKYYQDGEKISNKFGTSRFIQLNVTPNKTNTGNVLIGLAELDNEIEVLYPNSKTQSLHTSDKLLDINEESEESISDLLNRAADLPLVDELIGKSKKSFLFIIHVDSSDVFDESVLDKVIKQDYNGIERITAMSSFHVEKSIATAIGHDLVVLSGLIILLFCGFVLFAFRSVKALVFAFSIIGISLFPALFLFNILQVDINLVTVLIFPVVLILSLSDAIHLLTGFTNINEENYEMKMKAILRKYFVPSFLTSLTTAVAFLSFLFNDAPNIRDFGLITGILVLLSFVLTFCVAPFLLDILKIKSKSTGKIFALGTFLDKNRRVFGFGLIVIFLISIAFLPSLKFQTDLNDFFPKNTQLYEDNMEIQEEYYSQIRMELILEGSENNKEELKKLIPQLHENFEAIEEVGTVKSIKNQNDFKKKFGPLGSLIHFPTKNNPFVTRDKQTYRIELRLTDTKHAEKVEADVLKILSPYNEKYSTALFCKSLLIKDINKKVAGSLFESLLFSGILILIVLFLITRSIISAFISILADLIPLASMILIFYLFNLDLNILTAITAVVCMGLIVDDTIHVLYRKIYLKDNLKELSFGILTTSIILFLGFMTFALSSFTPSKVFGVVSAIIFLMTVISDLTLLPWLLDLTGKFKKK